MIDMSVLQLLCFVKSIHIVMDREQVLFTLMNDLMHHLAGAQSDKIDC